MLKYEADMLRKHPPQLAPGEVKPDRPVYWLIWVLDAETRKPYHSRACWDKVLTPVEACQKAYGMVPSQNMLFFNLTHRVVEARKRLRVIAQKWHEATGGL
jgi:hypothetical protein